MQSFAHHILIYLSYTILASNANNNKKLYCNTLPPYNNAYGV